MAYSNKHLFFLLLGLRVNQDGFASGGRLARVTYGTWIRYISAPHPPWTSGYPKHVLLMESQEHKRVSCCSHYRC